MRGAEKRCGRSSRIRRRERAAPGAAADLAWRLDRLCRLGIELRERGWCTGELSPADVEIDETGIRRTHSRGVTAGWRWRRLQRRHIRNGHDEGCLALGVPRSALDVLLRAWDRGGAAELLGETLDEVIGEIMSETAEWSPRGAGEVLQVTLHARITPAPLRKGANAAGAGTLGHRHRGSGGAAAPGWMPRPLRNRFGLNAKPR